MDRTLASLEAEQLRNNDIQNFRNTVTNPPTNNTNMINEQIKKQQENLQNIQNQRQFNQFREQSIQPTVVGTNRVPSSPTSTVGSPAVGTSIASNTTMNPAAAASLYTGNTDAALANQFGNRNNPVQQMPRLAAKGGIISLVS